MLLQIFAAWPLPAPPACTMVLPMASRIGLRALEGVVRPADHEGERAALRAADAAGDRRVHHQQALRLGRRRDLARGLDIDGRGIDQQRAGRARVR